MLTPYQIGHPITDLTYSEFVMLLDTRHYVMLGVEDGSHQICVNYEPSDKIYAVSTAICDTHAPMHQVMHVSVFTTATKLWDYLTSMYNMRRWRYCTFEELETLANFAKQHLPQEQIERVNIDVKHTTMSVHDA